MCLTACINKSTPFAPLLLPPCSSFPSQYCNYTVPILFLYNSFGNVLAVVALRSFLVGYTWVLLLFGFGHKKKSMSSYVKPHSFYNLRSNINRLSVLPFHCRNRLLSCSCSTTLRFVHIVLLCDRYSSAYPKHADTYLDSCL